MNLRFEEAMTKRPRRVYYAHDFRLLYGRSCDSYNISWAWADWHCLSLNVEAMREAWVSVSPEIGITFGDDDDDVQIDLSLYLRHYVYNCFNTKDLPIGKFSHNYLGLQAAITLWDA